MSKLVTSVEEGLEFAKCVELPIELRPSYTLRGAGSGTIYKMENLAGSLRRALDLSPLHEVLLVGG